MESNLFSVLPETWYSEVAVLFPAEYCLCTVSVPCYCLISALSHDPTLLLLSAAVSQLCQPSVLQLRWPALRVPDDFSISHSFKSGGEFPKFQLTFSLSGSSPHSKLCERDWLLLHHHSSMDAANDARKLHKLYQVALLLSIFQFW